MPTYTVKFPLSVVSKEDTFAVIDETNIKEVVKFNIKSTILTCPGERRSNPDFGVCAKRSLFEFSGDTSQLFNEIVNQISEYVPYCSIDNLKITTPDDSPNTIFITLEYSIPLINQKDVFELILST